MGQRVFCSLHCFSLVFYLLWSSTSHGFHDQVKIEQLRDDQNVGCGAGQYMMKDPTVFSLTMRATTNQSFSTQLFGVSSGTCGCRKHQIVQGKERQRQLFWALHQQDILVELAEYREEKPYFESYQKLLHPLEL